MVVENLSQLIHHEDEAIILATAQTSNIIDLKGLTLIAIITPSVLTSTKLTFSVAGEVAVGVDPSTVILPYVSAPASGIIELTIAVDNYIGLAAVDFAPVRYVQIKTDMVEAADRVFKLFSRRIS